MKADLIFKKSFALLLLYLLLFSCISKGKKDSSILEEKRDTISVTSESTPRNIEDHHSDQNAEAVSAYRCLPSDIVDASYKIVGKESGYYYCVSINGKEYRISDMIDYGELDLKVYSNGDSSLLLIGLTDFYASVYFVYYFKDDVLTRLGQIDIEQPEDVEEHGVREITIKVNNGNEKIVVESYLDDKLASRTEFL